MRITLAHRTGTRELKWNKNGNCFVDETNNTAVEIYVSENILWGYIGGVKCPVINKSLKSTQKLIGKIGYEQIDFVTNGNYTLTAYYDGEAGLYMLPNSFDMIAKLRKVYISEDGRELFIDPITHYIVKEEHEDFLQKLYMDIYALYDSDSHYGDCMLGQYLFDGTYYR